MAADSPAPDAILLTVADVCARLRIGITHLKSLRRSGRFPLRPVKLGRCLRFSALELSQWADAGHPPASRWSFIKEQAAVRRTG